MSDLDYVTINVREQFPELWKEYANLRMGKGKITGSSSFNNFLKDKQINGFVNPASWLGEVQIRKDHLMWLKLKYQ